MAKGGKRPGAGRPKGSRDPHTKSRQVVEEEFRAFMLKSHAALWQGQLERALGAYVLVVKTETGYARVTDPEAIARLLAVPQDRGVRYWRIEARAPDPVLVKEINNRLMGVPRQEVEVSGALSLAELLAAAELKHRQG
ncbi:MAG TPA: hypothetical protein VKE26_26145 [Xanthobacteraceae bacterium]|nr:hypothetical protein [Xanthobacteraceae bacterium]